MQNAVSHHINIGALPLLEESSKPIGCYNWQPQSVAQWESVEEIDVLTDTLDNISLGGITEGKHFLFYIVL